MKRPTIEQVIRLNEIECAKTGETAALLDRGVLAAALARPWSGFGDFEAYPSVYEKAAALLHGIASRQVFENGNKRTAWLTAVTVLDRAGMDIGRVETVQSDMFVRAAALDHTLEIADLAEWFEVAHRSRRAGSATDPRVEYLMLTTGAAHGEGGVVHTLGAHTHTMVIQGHTDVTPINLTLVTRIHWAPADAGREHQLTVTFDEPMPDGDGQEQAWLVGFDAPVPSGHPHHAGGLVPSLTTVAMLLLSAEEGRHEFAVELDGVEVGRVPLWIVHA